MQSDINDTLKDREIVLHQQQNEASLCLYYIATFPYHQIHLEVSTLNRTVVLSVVYLFYASIAPEHTTNNFRQNSKFWLVKPGRRFPLQRKERKK